VDFEKVGDLEVNVETAIDQLNRYKLLMDNYVEQNCSVTVSYDPSEVDAIIDWLLHNWDHYVGVSFLLRADPLKTAEDLGFPYLPQQPVSKAVFDAYVAQLKPIDLDQVAAQSEDEVDMGSECAGGACPVR
jgi:ribonucleoside-triphosphate reductase